MSNQEPNSAIWKTWQTQFKVSLQSTVSLLSEAVVEIQSNARSLTFTVTDPKGKKLETQSGKGDFRYHFAAFTAGNHQICVQNTEKTPVVINFSLSSGVQAIDYTNIVTKKHLKPVELQAQKIVDMIEQLRSELGSLVVSEEKLKAGNQKIKTRVVLLGLVSVAVMGVSTWFQIKYLKNFFRNKKIM